MLDVPFKEEQQTEELTEREVGFSHYIVVDDRLRVLDGWSDGVHPDRDTTSAICITTEGNYQFQLHPRGAENPLLYEFDDMIPLYKYEDGQIILRTAEEIEADRATLPEPEETPSQLDQIEAQVTYTAMMTDTLLEV